jgi:hypothetical protein
MDDLAEELFIGAPTEMPDDDLLTAADLLNQPPTFYDIPKQEIEDA